MRGKNQEDGINGIICIRNASGGNLHRTRVSRVCLPRTLNRNFGMLKGIVKIINFNGGLRKFRFQQAACFIKTRMNIENRSGLRNSSLFVTIQEEITIFWADVDFFRLYN